MCARYYRQGKSNVVVFCTMIGIWKGKGLRPRTEPPRTKVYEAPLPSGCRFTLSKWKDLQPDATLELLLTGVVDSSEQDHFLTQLTSLAQLALLNVSDLGVVTYISLNIFNNINKRVQEQFFRLPKTIFLLRRFPKAKQRRRAADLKLCGSFQSYS